MLKHGRDFGQVQFMEFPWYLLGIYQENDEISIGFEFILDHFRPHCRQKDMRKSISHFLQGKYKDIAQFD